MSTQLSSRSHLLSSSESDIFLFDRVPDFSFVNYSLAPRFYPKNYEQFFYLKWSISKRLNIAFVLLRINVPQQFFLHESMISSLWSHSTQTLLLKLCVEPFWPIRIDQRWITLYIILTILFSKISHFTSFEAKPRKHNLLAKLKILIKLSYSFIRLNMVGLGRLELPTPRLSSVCSNQLSYRPALD